MPSRRKMCWKVRVTEVVPAPDEPVMAITGGCAVMTRLQSERSSEERTGVEQGGVEDRLGPVEPGLDGTVVVRVVGLEALDLLTGTERKRGPFVKPRGH